MVEIIKGDIRDFDGDGDLDILANSGENGSTYLFVNQSNPVTNISKQGKLSTTSKANGVIKLNPNKSALEFHYQKGGEMHILNLKGAFTILKH